jgi:ATP-dependent exoDNAse (exonuclease V) alpha subunit
MGRTLQEGDKVMQIRNNYEKDVYNGDIGTVVMVDGTIAESSSRWTAAVY